jgi:hypothetical protein
MKELWLLQDANQEIYRLKQHRALLGILCVFLAILAYIFGYGGIRG